MKKVIPVLLLSFAIVLGACNKDDIHNTDTKVGISRVTNFAVFEYSGPKYVALVQGSAYVEPGVKAFEAGNEIPVQVSGTVNANQPGLYTINYSAQNKDGFSSSTSRTVVVLSAHEDQGVDLSGKYDYVGTGSYTSTVAKVAEGTYTTDNAWSAATTIPLVFISLDGLTVDVPEQPTGFGPALGTGTYNPATKRLVYTLTLTAQGISNSNRTWQKQ